MTGPGATAGASAGTELPPRRETSLARYSRKSKLATAGLSLVGLAALIYLFHHMHGLEHTSRPVPKVFSADSLEQSSGAKPAQNESAPAKGSTEKATLNQQDDHSIVMAPAPDPDLTEATPQGDLPRIGEDGHQPWQVYARPFNASDPRPRLAIVVTDLGLSRGATGTTLSQLPANVTLAFDAQGPAIPAWCGRARQEGHEVLLSVPMEPFDFPRSDPGSHALLTSLSNTANLENLNWALRQGMGYVGITTLTGSRFTTDSAKLKTVMETLHQRGLMVLDAHVAPHSAVTDLAHELHVPVATVNQKIDDNLSPEAIDAALQDLEQAARLNGRAVGVVAPLPIIIDHLQNWLKTLPQDGIALAPVSAVVQ